MTNSAACLPFASGSLNWFTRIWLVVVSSTQSAGAFDFSPSRVTITPFFVARLGCQGRPVERREANKSKDYCHDSCAHGSTSVNNGRSADSRNLGERAWEGKFRWWILFRAAAIYWSWQNCSIVHKIAQQRDGHKVVSINQHKFAIAL